MVGLDRENDVAVFATGVKLGPRYPLSIGMAGVILSQEVYFLGFPYSMITYWNESKVAPLPFVKKAIVSQIELSEHSSILYLDGHNNPGFSGGPVVCKLPKHTDWMVVGVIYALAQGNESSNNG